MLKRLKTRKSGDGTDSDLETRLLHLEVAIAMQDLRLALASKKAKIRSTQTA